MRVSFPLYLEGFEHIYELHSKKSHKGNWEVFLHILGQEIPCHSCIRRNPTKGIERLLWRQRDDEYPTSGCIRRNPTKGIERYPVAYRIRVVPDVSCIRRNPTKGIERSPAQIFLQAKWFESRCIRRNPTKGIESRMSVGPARCVDAQVAFEEIPQRELRAWLLCVSGGSFMRLYVAFEEIPQRELRNSWSAQTVSNHKYHLIELKIPE